MSSTEVAVALPISANPSTWNADTAAMMEFAGLTWVEKRPNPDVPGEMQDVRFYAPPGIMAGFISACRRTGLDPTAKQIYAANMKRGGWTILVGIDGMRVVAQRTGEYDGQDPMEWQMTEGGPWSTTPGPGKPYAARISIYRKGISRPMTTTVTWAEFGDDEAKPESNWGKRPCWQLGIRAESHGFRRLFPNDLSGLYTREDFTTDAVDTSDALVISETENWAALIESAQTREEIGDIVARARERNELTDVIRTAALTRYGMLARAEEDPPAEPGDEQATEPADEDVPVSEDDVLIGDDQADDNARLAAAEGAAIAEAEDRRSKRDLTCRDCLEGKHGACTGTAIVDTDPDSDPLEVPCVCATAEHEEEQP